MLKSFSVIILLFSVIKLHVNVLYVNR